LHTRGQTVLVHSREFFIDGFLDGFAPVAENLPFHHPVKLLDDVVIHSDGELGFSHFEPSV